MCVYENSNKAIKIIFFCLFLGNIFSCTANFEKKEISTSYPIIKDADAVYVGYHPNVVLLENSDNFNFQMEFEHEIGQSLYKIGIINKSQYWLNNSKDFEEKFFQSDYSIDSLRKYRTNNRFILFSELEKCEFNMQTSPRSFNTVIAGLLLTSTLIGAPLGIPMMIAGGLPVTDATVSFKYELYIYDRKLDVIAWKDKIDITNSDSTSGSIEKKDRKDILNYYKSIITDAFITSFQKGINTVKRNI
jgi:hypothetical protein